MKTILKTLLALLFVLQLPAQGIEFFHGSWDEALAQAKEQDKLIFVDAFTTWCGPCKRMAANVFPDERVGSFYNQNFVSLKLDMEREAGLEFQKTYPVSAYPTLFFIDGDGKVVEKVRGALDVNRFLTTGQKALSKMEPDVDYAADYASGKRDAKFIYKYVRFLIRSDESHLRVANDFLRNQKDLTQPDNLKLILLAATETDSRIFDLLTKYQKEIAALEGKEALHSRAWQAGMKTAAKATEFASHDLLEEAWDKVENVYPERADEFRVLTEMKYTQHTRDSKAYLKACKEYTSKIVHDDAEVLEKQAKGIARQFSNDSKAMDMAEDLAETASTVGNSYKYFFTYATILNQRGKKKEALAAAQQSLEMAQKESPTAVRTVNFLIRTIEGA